MLVGITEDGRTVVSGFAIFQLLDTFGFPLDLAEEILKEHNCIFDSHEFIVAALRSGNFSFSKLLSTLSVLSYYNENYYKRAILYIFQKEILTSEAAHRG